MLTRPKDKKTVVFLCTGDTCRGPMAKGYLQSKLAEAGIAYIEVKSAGVMTVPGLVPTPEARQVLEKEGVDITRHRSSPLTPELVRRADLILGMTPFHVQQAVRVSEEARDKTHLLKEFTKSDMKNYQVTDPLGMTLEVYKRVYREVRLSIDNLLKMDFVAVPPPGVAVRLKARQEAAARDKERERARLEAEAAEAEEAAKPAKKPAKAKDAPAKAEAPAKAPAKKAAAKPTAKKSAPAKKDAPAKKSAPAKVADASKKAAPAKASAKKAAKPAAKKTTPKK